ncbi:MAG TPA: SoxR reducing system RseC family protein [Xanthomonadales bacterium]|nr:SoxR reducing system RseC family protein [Xanthomonadales bacterium]
MIEQQGRILRLESGRAVITLDTVSGCPACDAGKGCGAGVFGRLVRRRPPTLVVDNPEALVPGQAVIIGIPETLFLSLLAKLYLLPVLAGLAGAAAGHYLAYRMSLQDFAQDLFALLGALILAAATLHSRKTGKQRMASESLVQLLQCAGVATGEEPRQYCQSGKK